MTGLIAGLTLGFSLIFAIGSQNAFVLKQGLKNNYIFTVCMICALSDAILIVFGVTSFSLIITKLPWVESVARIFGVIFLLYYGLSSFISAFKSESLLAAETSVNTFKKVILTSLAFTWLNPHVYLDTVVLIGSVSSGYPEQKVEFAIGAFLSSFIFFFSLGYGARYIQPLFKSELSWKILDILIGIIMWVIAYKISGLSV